jgi:hypothetical protein
MKTDSSRSSFAVKSGNVSRARARAAARAAKTGRASRTGSKNAGLATAKKSLVWERFLGHFGPSAKKAPLKRKSVAAKQAVKQAVKRSTTTSSSRKVASRA